MLEAIEKEGEREREKEREGRRWFPEFEGAGAVFSVRFWRRNGDGGEGEECLIPRVHRPPLLYEILIQGGDIRQAYIRLACKSPPYLISRGCDAPGDDGSFYAAATFPSLPPLPPPFRR